MGIFLCRFWIEFVGFGEEVEFWLDLGLGVVEMQNLTHFGLVAMEFVGVDFDRFVWCLRF